MSRSLTYPDSDLRLRLRTRRRRGRSTRCASRCTGAASARAGFPAISSRAIRRAARAGSTSACCTPASTARAATKPMRPARSRTSGASATITGRSATSTPRRSSRAIPGSSIPAICKAAVRSRDRRQGRDARHASRMAGSSTSSRSCSMRRAGRMRRSTSRPAPSERDALPLIGAALARAQQEAGGRPLAVRITLIGQLAGPCATSSRITRRSRTRRARSASRYRADCWVEQVKIATANAAARDRSRSPSLTRSTSTACWRRRPPIRNSPRPSPDHGAASRTNCRRDLRGEILARRPGLAVARARRAGARFSRGRARREAGAADARALRAISRIAR